ncbi:helix-turn-helix domain-containing protein [Yersinia enterocolitica]|uniref:helix-turn-helix domain-containing protein n=1 Tax=Yersinia enterocolitica TaxID=630 RepID=UPI003CFC67E6
MTENNNNNNVRTFSKNYTDVSSIQHIIINGEKKLFGWSLKFLYGYLLTFQENTGGAVYPSEKRIAEDLGAGIKTISKHLKGLEELGLVKKESRKGLSNIYYVLDINEVVGFKTDLTGQLKGTRYERAEQPLEQVKQLTNAKVPPKPVSAFIEAKSQANKELHAKVLRLLAAGNNTIEEIAIKEIEQIKEKPIEIYSPKHNEDEDDLPDFARSDYKYVAVVKKPEPKQYYYPDVGIQSGNCDHIPEPF